jgi:cytosine/adenosine deaminase-related metal-dependent hydrolase
MAELVFRGGTIVTLDAAWTLATGDVACRDGVIVQVGGHYTPTGDDYQIVDARDCVVMPGLVQTHVHMCQTLARGRADDLELLDWLQRVVWPYEAALTGDDVAAAAALACTELLLGGTTCVLDMGTVHHTEQLFATARDAGIRATIGKAMMDVSEAVVPAGLRETTRASLDESAVLLRDWHERTGGRLRYAYAPRFALSCSDDLLTEVGVSARRAGVRIHTHACENRAEIAAVLARTGTSNIEYLHARGLTGPDVCLAHCVWLSDAEQRILAETGTQVLHCPSSNLKLGSGVALVPELLAAGIPVSLGADGAPCNNNLDGFLEMRLAALLHRPRAGVRSLPAAHVLRMATLDGARALGLDAQIGSLEVGKRADLIAVELAAPHVVPTEDPYSAVVFGCRASDVRHVAVDGRLLVQQRALLTLDRAAVLARARSAARQIFARMS